MGQGVQAAEALHRLLGGRVHGFGKGLRERGRERAEEVRDLALPAEAQEEEGTLHPSVFGRGVAHHLLEPGEEGPVGGEHLVQVLLHHSRP